MSVSSVSPEHLKQSNKETNVTCYVTVANIITVWMSAAALSTSLLASKREQSRMSVISVNSVSQEHL
jgi:hypothetical protein